MRKLTYAAAMAALIGLAGPVSAETIQGTIASYDPASQQVMLQNGEAFRLQSGIDATVLTEGASVTLNVEQVDGEAVVTAIQLN